MGRLRYRRGLTGGAPFEGAYDDIANIVHIYEPARRVLTAYTGNLVRLRRASDNAERDFGYDADGDLDVTAIAAWAGGASYVVTIYDQIGSDDITQATAAKQPLFTASAQNGHAGMTFDGTDDFLKGTYTNGGQLSQPISMYSVAQLDAGEINNDTNHVLFDGDDGVNVAKLNIRTTVAPDAWSVRANTQLHSTAATDSTWNIWSFLFNGASSEYWRDNISLKTGDTGAANPDGLTLGAASNGAFGWKGLTVSLIVIDPSHTTAQREAMQTAINDYWAVY